MINRYRHRGFVALLTAIFCAQLASCGDGSKPPSTPPTSEAVNKDNRPVDTSHSTDSANQKGTTAATGQIIPVMPIDISKVQPTTATANNGQVAANGTGNTLTTTTGSSVNGSSTGSSDNTWTQVCSAYQDICNTVKWVASIGKPATTTTQTTTGSQPAGTTSTTTNSANNNGQAGGFVTSP